LALTWIVIFTALAFSLVAVTALIDGGEPRHPLVPQQGIYS
jgi:hypothetical protein